MKGEDISILLSLMQSGVVARLKKGMREVDQMTTWIFAGVNRKDRLAPEGLSRFVAFDFNPTPRRINAEPGSSVPRSAVTIRRSPNRATRKQNAPNNAALTIKITNTSNASAIAGPSPSKRSAGATASASVNNATADRSSNSATSMSVSPSALSRAPASRHISVETAMLVAVSATETNMLGTRSRSSTHTQSR